MNRDYICPECGNSLKNQGKKSREKYLYCEKKRGCGKTFSPSEALELDDPITGRILFIDDLLNKKMFDRIININKQFLSNFKKSVDEALISLKKQKKIIDRYNIKKINEHDINENKIFVNNNKLRNQLREKFGLIYYDNNIEKYNNLIEILSSLIDESIQSLDEILKEDWGTTDNIIINIQEKKSNKDIKVQIREELEKVELNE